MEGNQRQWSNYREAQLAQAAGTGIPIVGRNPRINRIIERDELKRWSIELMRGRAFDLNAIDLTGYAPGIAFDRVDGVRNVTTFFERAFEWSQMTYWFYPYFWGRREQWKARLALSDPDPLHEHFLKAGAARTLVPVTPGYEERVLHYIGTIGEEDPKLVWLPDLEQQANDPAGAIPPHTANPDIWMEVILSKNKELAFGSGTLTVRNGAPDAIINSDSEWRLDGTDIDRDLYIEGFPYTITAIGGSRSMMLDRPYERADNDTAEYLVASVRVGAPWEVIVPTNLVVLADQADKLNREANVNAIAPEDILERPAGDDS